MNKKWKRILSMVLALAMVVTMLPTSGLRAKAALVEENGTVYVDALEGTYDKGDLYNAFLAQWGEPENGKSLGITYTGYYFGTGYTTLRSTQIENASVDGMVELEHGIEYKVWRATYHPNAQRPNWSYYSADEVGSFTVRSYYLLDLTISGSGTVTIGDVQYTTSRNNIKVYADEIISAVAEDAVNDLVAVGGTCGAVNGETATSSGTLQVTFTNEVGYFSETISGTGTVTVGGEAVDSTKKVAAGAYNVTITPDWDNKYYVESLTIGDTVYNLDEYSFSNGAVTVAYDLADGETADIKPVFKQRVITVKEPVGDVYRNPQKAILQQTEDVRKSVLDAIVSKAPVGAEVYDGTVEVYNAGISGYGASWGALASSDLYFNDAQESFAVSYAATDRYPEVSVGYNWEYYLDVVDARPTPIINAVNVTISVEDEPTNIVDIIENLMAANGASVTATKYDGTPLTYDFSEVEITMPEGYVFPAEGDTVPVTVTVSLGANDEHLAATSVTATVIIKHFADENNNNTDDDTEAHYNIIYIVDGAEYAKYEQQLIGIATPKPEDPSKKYYTFTDWTPDVADTVIGAVTYVATWQINNDANGNNIPDETEVYYVVYVDGLGNTLYTSEALAWGADTPSIADPTRDGYFFKGWNPEFNATVETPATGNTITYTATWSEECVITLVYGNGSENYKDEVEEGYILSAPTDPTRESYLFQGWMDKDGNLVSFPYTVNDSVTLTAKWAEDFNGNNIDDATEAHYTVTYNVDGVETKFENRLVGTAMPTIDAPSKEGYIFAGWDKNVAATVTADVVYTATWYNDTNKNSVNDANETINVTIVGNGSLTIDGDTVTNGSCVYDSTKATHTVVATPADVNGSDGYANYISSAVAGEADLTTGTFANAVLTNEAVALSNGMNVQVVFGERTIAGTNGNSVAFNPYKADRTAPFVGEYRDYIDELETLIETAVLGGDLSDHSIKVYVQRLSSYSELNSVAIQALNAGATENIQVTLSGDDRYPQIVDVFTVVLYDERTETSITANDVNLSVEEAPATLAEAVSGAFTVSPSGTAYSLNSNYAAPADGETYTGTYTVKISETVDMQGAEAPANLVVKNFKDENNNDADDDFEAHYTIIYNVDGTETKFENVLVDTATPTVDDPSKDYYTFAGWTPSVEPTVTADAIYTATWTINNDNNANNIPDEIEKYTVVYDFAGGVDANGNIGWTVTDLAYGAETPTIANPTRDGFYFKGWNPAVVSTVQTPEQGITITYTATWSEKCTITFVYGNGTENTVTEVEAGETVSAPAADPTREDYLFLGWYLGDVKYDFTAQVTDSITLTAKWAEDFNGNDIDDATEAHYDIVYVDGFGNELKKFEDVLVGLDTPVIADPAVENYKFNGWDPEVAQIVTSDATYTAQWLNDANNNKVDDALETITVVINGNGAVTVNGESVTTYLYDSTGDKTITVVATPVVEGGLSKTYVSAVAVDDVFAELTYNNRFAATASFTADGSRTVTVTFTEAGFVLNDDRLMNYYDGMTGVKNEDVYDIIVDTPEYADATEITLKYKAREAMTHTISVDSLDINDTLKRILKLAIGETIKFDMPDLWLDVNVEVEGQVKDSVSLEQAVNANLTSEKLNGILDAFKTGGLSAAKAELDKIIAEIYNSAMYYGAHNFGYNATGEETVTEEIKITYKNEAMYIECETDITLKDMRAASFVVGENVELIYRDYTDEDLAAAIGAYVTDANGNTVEGAVITSVDITDPYTFEGKNVSEVAYEITFKFAGNEEYKPSEAKFTVTVKKAPITVFDAPNVNVFYGEEYSIIPEMTLGNKYGQEKEVTDSLIQFIIGLDISDLDVDQDGVHGLNGKIQLILTPDLQKLLDIVAGGDSSNKEMSLSQLTEYLQYIDDTSVDALKQALNALSQITEMGDITIVIGDELPTNIGAYLHGSVTTSANYETAFDVGYLLIKPRATEVYLDFNYNDTNGVFTPELLQHVNLGASAYDEEALTTLNADATALVNNVFFGIDTNGELVATLFNGDVDPENIENELGNGAYTQLSFIAEFGNEFYYAVPIVRAFVIMPNTVEVEIVDNEGTEFNRTFDNAEQTVDVELSYTEGTLIVPSEEYLTVTYSGVQTNGKTWNSETAPTHAGAYVVTAIYVQRDDKGEVIAIGADVQPMVVKPAETATTVEDLTVAFGTDVNYVEDMVTVETSSGVTMPDMTVITGSVAVDGDIVTAGWDAVEGNVNIDFPDWVDDVLKEHAPSIYDGMTASEFTAKVIEKVPGIIEKIEAMIAEYGIEANITQYVDTLVAALDEVKAIVDQLPVDVNLTFDEKLTEGRVGVYLVAAVVTDSDHMPSADMGILVIEPSDDLVVDIKDTTVTYNGQEQMPDVLAMIGENYVTTDMVYVIINEELNANLILEDDAQALLDLIAAELGVEEVPESITLGELKAALEGIMSDIKAEAADSSLAAVIAALGITKEDIKAVIAELETKVIGYLTEKGLTAESGISLNAAKPVDAGIYKVCGLAIVENYIPQLTEGTLVIKPKEVTVTVADAEKTYGDADPEFIYEVEGLVEGDELDVTVSREEGETVGEYTITADYVENKNYVVTVVDGTLTINPKDVTVTVDSASKVYGDADPKFTATVNGLVGEDKLEISYSRETGEDVGEYAITATVADNKNYDVTVENTGKLTINPKEITAADVALDGTLVYNGSEQTQGVKITDGITYDVTGNTGNDAGDYTLTVTGNGNYTGEVELSWTIAKAEVVITVSDMEMVITDPVPELQYQVAVTAPGAVTAEQLGVRLSVDTDGKTLGEFDIEVIYTESYNWTVTVVDGKLTVGLGDYVCWNMQTGKYYAELSTALKEADDMDARTTSVETIQMLKDCTESYIMVTTGTTLDLNGFKVTSRFVAAVDGAHIIDSQNCTGRLVTGMNNVTLDEQNKMLPVYDGDAYIFGGNTLFAISKDNKYTGDGFKLNTLPAPDTRIAELLKDGAVDNNLQIIVRLTWDTDQGVKSQDFSFREEVIEEVYQSHTGDKQTSYTLRFYMIITGIEGVDNLRANILFASGTDTEIISANSLSIN